MTKPRQYGRKAEPPKLGQAVISCPLFISSPPPPPILASSYPFETSQHFPGAPLCSWLLAWAAFYHHIFINYFWAPVEIRAIKWREGFSAAATAISASGRGFLCQKKFGIDLNPKPRSKALARIIRQQCPLLGQRRCAALLL